MAAIQVYLWIGLGSALGGMARYGCSGLVARLMGETFPWGTILVNVLGSFVIGLFGTLIAPDGRLMVTPCGAALRHARAPGRLHDVLLVQLADPGLGS
jgi:fluoride ion exporter CrcB/FEX